LANGLIRNAQSSHPKTVLAHCAAHMNISIYHQNLSFPNNCDDLNKHVQNANEPKVPSSSMDTALHGHCRCTHSTEATHPWRCLRLRDWKAQARTSSQTRPAASASGPSSARGTHAQPRPPRLPWPPMPRAPPPWHSLMTTGAACTGTSPGASSARTGSTWQAAHGRRWSWSTDEGERCSWPQ
jgi:hypothetical protein